MYAYEPGYDPIEHGGAPRRFKGPFCESDHFKKPAGKLPRHRWKGSEKGPFPETYYIGPPLESQEEYIE